MFPDNTLSAIDHPCNWEMFLDLWFPFVKNNTLILFNMSLECVDFAMAISFWNSYGFWVFTVWVAAKKMTVKQMKLNYNLKLKIRDE